MVQSPKGLCEHAVYKVHASASSVSNAPTCLNGAIYFQVCMYWESGGSCVKTGTVSHACIGDQGTSLCTLNSAGQLVCGNYGGCKQDGTAPVCPYTGYGSRLSGGWPAGVQYKLCQSVRFSTTRGTASAVFHIKDGSARTCGSSSTTISGYSATCGEPTPTACMGGSFGECTWTFTIPYPGPASNPCVPSPSP
eukprot:CAMPEP_0202913976 /NCGR_PEP_ID=MMETSP1392-20130828/61927_1 /ASSEMBLY_ACC=CAM_ASM_000868 /TAXON_ID=225041 /ORGANISM="Chlamydomonas chlamydogama, Strain SAG 11-48b" /LENGTH=192 /DNA_ID=CAMNT_0049605449 /DNA_START=162 /DNA_END=735 /DNA_ORIENTATION=-